MKILLTGASGFIGRNLLQALRVQGHEVVTVSRSQGVNFQQMQQVSDWLAFLQGVDAVINAVGIIAEVRGQRFDVIHSLAPKALFQTCAKVGVRRVIQISALGADERAATPYHLTKRAADDELRRLNLDWFVLRPSLVYGAGGASSGLFMQLAALPVIPLVGAGQQQVQPVHISDLVASVLRCLQVQSAHLTLDIVGPQVFGFAQWLQQMRSAQGLGTARFVSIPLALVMAACRLGRYLSPLMQPDNLRMLQAGSTADVRPLAQFLGRNPVPVAPALFFTNGANNDEL
ncbi:MAG: NAD-dependent epimerase/dehydratase family protein [Sphingobacteriales bacterium]|nr:MAG: NAD-dependent epimerase/dehydratase family protein [Sphingobacteriales bacterium]